MTDDWKIKGEYAESCNCSVPCQCLWNEAPDDNVCTAAVFWNIDEGAYGDVSLNGLTAGFLLDQQGVLFDGGWKIVLVLDEAADEDQAEALETILLGQAGGIFGALGSMVDEVVDTVALPFEYSRENGHWELEAGDTVSIDADGSTGLEGEQGTVFPHEFLLPSKEANIGKSNESVVAFDDQFSWDLGGNTAYFGDFEYGTA